MLAETYALESMTYLTAGIVDGKVADYSLESAICKIMGSETVWRVVNEALQIAAGIGYMQDYPYERLLRDARINLIFEGTNEILRCFVALSGMQGPGKALAEVVKAMREPIKGFGLLSDFAVRKARTVLGRERMTRAHPLLSREAVDLRGAHGRARDGRGERAPQARARHRRDAVHAEAHRRHGHRPLRRRRVPLAHDARHRAARRGRRAARDRPDRRSSPPRRRSACGRTSPTSPSNDDELRKSVASRAYVDGAYPFDIL